MRRARRRVPYAVLAPVLAVLLLATAACRAPVSLRRPAANPADSLVSVLPTPTRVPSPTAAPTPTSAATATLPSGIGGPEISWSDAIRLVDGARLGVVTVDSLNVRAAPRLSAPVLGNLYGRHPIAVYGQVTGDAVDGSVAWYRIGQGHYVSAAYVSPFIAPTPPQTFSGRWVDIDLSQFYAVAYDDQTPVYAAIVTAGRDGKTPTGVFQVERRVRNDTMDSATVGIPKGSPGYYYLANVQYTQYFEAGGYALHQNWWTPPDQFGNYSTNGCVGLLLPDAQWFWNFLAIGSTVSIHP